MKYQQLDVINTVVYITIYGDVYEIKVKLITITKAAMDGTCTHTYYLHRLNDFKMF